MKILLGYEIGKINKKLIQEAQLTEKHFDFINQKDFFSCIFSTPEQLTNFFLDRRSLDMEVHRIANHISQVNSKMVHLSVDYESLYSIVRQLEKTKSINEIGGLLAGVFNYAHNNLQEKLLNEFNSYKMRNLFQLNLSFLAQTIS
jgi:hypothetical protein